MKAALPGPCSRKLATPICESAEWKTSSNFALLDGQAVGERAGQAVVDRLLGQRLGDERTTGQFGRQRERPCVQFVVRHHLVGQPDPQGLLGAHLTPGQAELLRPAGPDRSGQTLRTAATGDDAEQDLGLAEHGLLRHDAVVAGQRQFASAAECVATDRGDDEAGQRGDRIQRVVEPGGDGGRLVGPAELGDVGARGEDPLAARHHHRAGRVGGQRLCSRPQFGEQRRRQRVDLAVGQGDDGHAVVASFEGEQRGVGHPAESCLPTHITPKWSRCRAERDICSKFRWMAVDAGVGRQASTGASISSAAVQGSVERATTSSVS